MVKDNIRDGAHKKKKKGKGGGIQLINEVKPRAANMKEEMCAPPATCTVIKDGIRVAIGE